MTIIALQRRLAEVGRIRIGQKAPKGNPQKLTTFRLTSADRKRIEQAAGLYGGRPGQWDAPAGRQWEVITETDALDVIVPPSDMAFSQAYELWSAGGCQRRCDGAQESISDKPCLCDPDNRDCDIHTRLSVMLRDLPGLGVWRIDTSGYYAAVELSAAVDVIQMAAGRGQMLPARLRLEQRQIKRPNETVKRFAVPVLDIEVSPAQLLAGSQSGQPMITAPAHAELTEGSQQIDGSAPLTPVPRSLPTGPSPSVAEQAAAVEQERERPRRRNAAAPIPSTGLRPRTAAEAAAADDVPPPSEPGGQKADRDTGSWKATEPQRKRLFALLKDAGLDSDQDRHTLVGLATDWRVTSSSDLTRDEYEQAAIIAELIGAGAVSINEDGPDGDPVLLKRNGDPQPVPIDVAKARAFLDGGA